MGSGQAGGIVRLLSCGDEALLAEVGSLAEALILRSELERQPPIGVSELVPGARTVLIRFDPAVTNPASVAAELRARRLPLDRLPLDLPPLDLPTIEAARAGTTVRIPVVYDGPDLDGVARLSGLSVTEVIERHCAASYLVAFIGFAPGFGYLAGGDQRLQVPRHATPRVRVAAGAVGLAGEFSGVYPREGPGGWRIVGRTDLPLWDLSREPAALLRPGVRVRFERRGS